jgi:hypothetical protein
MKKTNSSIIARTSSILLLILLAIHAKGQTQVDLRTQSKSVDFSRAASTLPVQTGTSLPSTCLVGALYFMTSAPAGANLYACVTANTWTLETGGAASSGAGAPSGTCNAGSVYNDTANSNTWLCENSGWQKTLTTDDTGTFVITGQAGGTPTTPATGSASLFFNSSARVAQSVDDTGNAATMVRPTDCAGSGQLLQKINADGTVTCSANVLHAIGYTFDAGGTALSSGATKYLTVPFACTIGAWNITVDSGTATIKTWKVAAGTSIPATHDSISVGGVSIGTGTAIHSTDVSDFTSTSVIANDILGFNLSAVSGATYLNFILECRQ